MISHIKILGHSAMPPDSVAERHAFELAIELIIPCMIDTAETGDIVLLLETNQRALVCAAVHHGMNDAFSIAGDHNRCFADRCCPVIARIRYLDLQTQETPDRATKDARLLQRVDLLIRKESVRRACNALLRPTKGVAQGRYCRFGCGQR